MRNFRNGGIFNSKRGKAQNGLYADFSKDLCLNWGSNKNEELSGLWDFLWVL